jgi:hypothetical protein
MSIITVIIVLIVIGALLYLLKAVLPIDDGIKTIIYVLVVVAVCVWLLHSLGVIPGGASNVRLW